jgi:hypothetical protein
LKTLTHAVLAALVLAGCQANLSAAVKPSAKASPNGTKPAATAGPRTLAAPAKLARPAGTVTVLAGHVAMDPTYAVGLAAGQVISTDGASVLAAGKVISTDGASVLAPNGGTVISNDGNSVISNDGHSVISNDGNSVISTDGASIISTDGSSIIAQGAGNVIAPAGVLAKDGGGLIGNDGASLVAEAGGSAVARGRRLFEAAPAAHEQRPAAGVAVYVRDLASHKPISLGQGPDGKPVYAVYTDLKGNYEFYLPPGQAANVEVVAFLPDKPDPRLHFQQVGPLAAPDHVVDEDTSAVVNYIRFGLRQFTSILLTGDTEHVRKAMHLDELAGVPAGYEVAVADITARIRAAGVDQLPEGPKRDALADRITDLVLAHAQLDLAVPSATAHGPLDPFGPEISKSSLAVLVENFRRRRQDMADRFDTPGEHERLDALPFVVDANARDHTSYHFRRPSDYADFVASAILGVPGTDPTAVAAAIARLDDQIGLPSRPGTTDWVQAAFGGIAKQFALALFVNGDVQDGLDQQLKQAVQP